MSTNKKLIIAVDFDGTVVKHAFPFVGADVPHAVESLKALVEDGHKLVLYTMRAGAFLAEAHKWFLDRGITLAGVQYAPGQTEWTASNKCYAQVYIDDAALGAPLIFEDDGRPYFDWIKGKAILNDLLARGLDLNPIHKDK